VYREPGPRQLLGLNYETLADANNLLSGTAAAHPGYGMMGAAQDMGAWAYYKNGYYGFDRLTNKPIDVAVIDSGVAPSPV
jgi:hypothetical protein